LGTLHFYDEFAFTRRYERFGDRLNLRGYEQLLLKLSELYPNFVFIASPYENRTLIALLQVRETTGNIKQVLIFRQINYAEARAMLDQHEDLTFLDETDETDVMESQGDWALSERTDASSTKPPVSPPV
jgi:hypothetical protein